MPDHAAQTPDLACSSTVQALDAAHHAWMGLAMGMVPSLSFPNLQCTLDDLRICTLQAEEALAAGEVPVGCIFVRDGSVIAKARNRTNELRNVTKPVTGAAAQSRFLSHARAVE